YLLHSLYKGILGIFILHRQTPLKIVHHRKDLLDHASGSDLVHGRFFLFRPFAEIIKFSHLPADPVCQFFYLNIFFILFIFLLAEKAFFRPGLLRTFFFLSGSLLFLFFQVYLFTGLFLSGSPCFLLLTGFAGVLGIYFL